MDTFFKQFSCFLFIVLFSTCSQIEARDSKFFSKYVHVSSNTNTNNYVTVPSTHVPNSASTPAPVPAPFTGQISDAPATLGAETGEEPVPAPAPGPGESENAYYGLYGKGGSSNQFPFKTTTTTTPAKDDEDEFSSEEFSTENFNMLHSGESNNYNNNLYSDNYNNNNGYSKSNLEGYTIEPQGMSDTRSLENGKYYYDIKNENYNTNIGDESVRENSNEGGYYNKKSKNEFDSMEEYERKEGYPDTQRDQYIP